jgi:hypothetical protein
MSARKMVIHLHAGGEPPMFETSDAMCIRVVAGEFPVTPALVGVRELATVLRNAGRGSWANRLDEYEEAHMVRLTISV